MQLLCAPGPQEHSLCGMAYDAHHSGDAEDPIVFARPGEQVTCKECRVFLDYVRRTFKRYRVEE